MPFLSVGIGILVTGLFNHVARFCFIEEEMTHGATLLVPASLNANQLEILKYFSVAKSSIHLIKPGAIVNVGRLFVLQCLGIQ